MTNYFKGSKEHPYHLSIGAVVLNDKNEVCCHYFNEIKHESFKGLKKFYILMRETMEIGEKIEDTLHRGLMEEFGVKADIIDYLGSIREYFDSAKGYRVEKTTLYFLVKVKSFDPKLRSKEDAEMESDIQWQTIDFLIPKMKEQSNMGSATLDESSILEKAGRYLGSDSL